MSLATIFTIFWPVSRCLLTHCTSAPFRADTDIDHPRYCDSSAIPPGPVSISPTFVADSDDQLSSLIDPLEARVDEFEALMDQFPSGAVEENKSPPEELSQEASTVVWVVFIVFIKIGFATLNEALDRVSERHSTRVMALGVFGANVVILGPLLCLGIESIGGVGVTWNDILVRGLFGLRRWLYGWKHYDFWGRHRSSWLPRPYSGGRKPDLLAVLGFILFLTVH